MAIDLDFGTLDLDTTNNISINDISIKEKKIAKAFSIAKQDHAIQETARRSVVKIDVGGVALAGAEFNGYVLIEDTELDNSWNPVKGTPLIKEGELFWAGGNGEILDERPGGGISLGSVVSAVAGTVKDAVTDPVGTAKNVGNALVDDGNAVKYTFTHIEPWQDLGNTISNSVDSLSLTLITAPVKLVNTIWKHAVE